MRVHLFPSRTQKLSSCTPTILGGRLPGKIGNANTRPHSFGCEVFSIDWNRRMSTCFRLRCPAKSASDEADLISADRGTCLPTRFIRHRRRSCAQPSRTQKLSSCTPTILGGPLLRCPANVLGDRAPLSLADRCHSLPSLNLPQAALGSLPWEDR